MYMLSMRSELSAPAFLPSLAESAAVCLLGRMLRMSAGRGLQWFCASIPSVMYKIKYNNNLFLTVSADVNHPRLSCALNLYN